MLAFCGESGGQHDLHEVLRLRRWSIVWLAALVTPLSRVGLHRRKLRLFRNVNPFG